jgi:hypothetical protein
MRIPFITLIAGSALALGGCAYGDLGMGLGYGSPYGTYGSYGYGSPYGYSSYGSYGGYGGYGYGSPYGYGMYGSGYGYGYGSPYGWYDNYYYPGTGYYVYDSYRQPHVMTTTQRQYWVSRTPALRTTTTRTNVRPNWSGFNRSTASAQRQSRQTARQERQQTREDRRQNRIR